MDAQWARNVRDLCQHCGIAFWFGGHEGKHQKNTVLDGRVYEEYPALLETYRRMMSDSPYSDASRIMPSPAVQHSAAGNRDGCEGEQ
jgi:hypothetical protein